MKQKDHASSLSASEQTADTTEEAPRQRHRLGGRSARVQANVFKATMDLVLSKGYHALTIAEIASRSGVHETSIYRRWKTKEALVSEVFAEHAKEAFPMPNTGKLRSDLTQLLHEVITFFQSPIGEAMMQVGIATFPVPALAFESYWSSRFAQFSTIVKRAIERGELPPKTDEQLLLKALIGPLYAQALLMHQSLDRTLSERIVDLVLNGATHDYD